eukprot:CAMPEP_0118926158 /NCGR_PEP_ID=MMETSP1169-20130426/3923_1 /TAXON_ID=36882 /ORGANISM="Pyramimonas obovata, Strain CCMP722" /LENGTH=37 /DNA_ID= /DNA_START= /DNA_END= /DNA_ORIENTATION=
MSDAEWCAAMGGLGAAARMLTAFASPVSDAEGRAAFS